ncbi:MAG TPA: DUF4139 domain-containing protein [Polyangiaceae bacterium]|nr:DUF4139 domain-containing protein [Polyangiaceae bacterium]
MSSVPEIACESRVESVVVYARGALVTRAVTLPPALPEGPVDLVVAGVTALAEPGGVRAELEGAREIVALRARLFLPEAVQAPGALAERVATLELERESLEAERLHVRGRRAALGGIALAPELPPRARRRLEPAAHFGDALAAGGLLGELVAELDARSRELDAALVRNERALEAARLAAAQGSSAESPGGPRPTLQFLLRLARSGATARGLTLTYAIAAARWWPTYAARLARGAARAEWALGALVAQSSGEDWSDVRLALSTADLAHDARLPELPSLRLGRAQPPPRKGYRPPPPGLDTMFAAFDRAVAESPPPAPPPARAKLAQGAAPSGQLAQARPSFAQGPYPASPGAMPQAAYPGAPPGGYPGAPPGGYPGAPPGAMPQAAYPGAPAEQPFGAGGAGDETTTYLDAGMLDSLDEEAFVSKPTLSGGFPMQASDARASGTRRVPPSPGAPLGYGAPSMPTPAAYHSVPMVQSASRSSGSFLPSFSFGETPRFNRSAAPSTEPPPPEPPPPVDPDDTWLDFDTLLLGEGSDRARRGRLVRGGGPAADARAARARHDLEAMPPPPRTYDPLTTRGVFDHRYDARGTADVPSDGRVHRVPLATAEAEVRLKLRVVPRESPDVFREAEVKNPFDAPLLAGPVDVFVEGALLTTAQIGAVDRGGLVALGLGVEDRVRAARNARVEEGSAGLLGGSSAIEHVVTVDLVSSLGAATPVEIVERVPVSDDKSVEVVSLGQTPPAEAYDQAERGHPLRGGLRWRLELPAGGKQRVEFRYRVTLPGKSEIVGGNRRE